MIVDSQEHNGDLQKTVMIPVLSLQPAEQLMPPPAAHTTSGITSGSTSGAAVGGISSRTYNTENIANAADRVCEKILQTTATLTTRANPILNAATALLMMAGQLRSAAAPKNSTHFSQLLINAMREFDRDLLHTQPGHETALVARYILCSTIDESVLSTGWGISSGWAHRSLLRLFHNEANGGDRFFALLEHAISRQQECRDLLELFYLCLSMGFEGRLHLDPRGHDKIETLRTQLYRILYREQQRSTELASRWHPHVVGDSATPQQKYLRTLVGAAAIAACSFGGLRLWLDVSADGAVHTLQQVFQVIPGDGI